MRFISPYGRHFRYNFGDKVKLAPSEIIISNDVSSTGIFTIINAKWIGNSKGFWRVTVETGKGRKRKLLRPKFKLVERRMND